MSGIGHLAVGFAAKPLAPKTPLWVLLAASEVNELLYFIFTVSGVEEKVVTTMDFQQGIHYLTDSVNPWSHGLLMSVVWSGLAVLAGYLIYHERSPACVIGAVVFSHWLLDFLMHSNLPLLFNGSPLVGLGLENTGAGFIFMTALDLVLSGVGIAIYLRYRKRRATGSKIGVSEVISK
jgi:membrane-bound metal-dependent hydrolase YbcI (DUF457 family)